MAIKGLHHDSKIELLGGLDVFEGLSKKQLSEIASLTTEIEVPAGRVLCEQGQHGEELFVIIQGEVSIAIDGKEVATLGPGDFFGEMALIDGGVRIASATAVTETGVLVLSRPEFRTLLSDVPEVAVVILEAVGKRLRDNATRKGGTPIGI